MLIDKSAKHYLYRSLICFGAIAAISLLTNPSANIAFTILFFVLLYILFFSLLCGVAILQFGTVSGGLRRRLLLISTFAVVFLMMLSTGSLSFVDFLILLLIVAGLYFYLGRR
jgi:hypothetical protein